MDQLPILFLQQQEALEQIVEVILEEIQVQVQVQVQVQSVLNLCYLNQFKL